MNLIYRVVATTLVASSVAIHAQSVRFELVEDYGNSYQAKGIITNDTNAPLTSWLATFTLDAPLDQNWNSVLQASASDPSTFRYAVSNESYNGDIAPGASEEFNYIVDAGTNFTQPSNAVISPNWVLVLPPALRVADLIKVEGDTTGSLTFVVTLSPAAETSVTVDYTTEAGTATDPSDYLAQSGSLQFAPGETVKTVTIILSGDEVEEANESFDLVLSNTTVELAKARATATLIDDDGESSEQGKPQTGPFNYAEVLQKSLWFYDAQRAGDLPEDFRVSWRGDSALGDGSDVSLDLTGGFFDAGDHVKFGFPMAFSLTLLSWGAVEYPAAYLETGQWPALLENLRWGADYFLKCHQRNPDGSTARFYGQVGDGNDDHAYWGTAETMTMARPAFAIDAANPGTDLAAETAASLAAMALLFESSDATYAAELLTHAEALYAFADANRGKYSDAIEDADDFYPSSGFQDELVWGALWLYRATNNPEYLTKARDEYTTLVANGTPAGWTLSWDDKSYGCFVLLAMLDGSSTYTSAAETWLDNWVTGNGVSYTPGGLARLDRWGCLRYAANTAFCSFVYADRVNDPGGQYSSFARNQIHYALGQNPNGRSFVCGFGVNPPSNPHHRNSHGSTTNSIANPTDNQHILYGALVGGPDANDGYLDDRTDFIQNEVAMDYNAGFTGAIARLYQQFGGFALLDLATTSPSLPAPLLAENTAPTFDVTQASRLAPDSSLYDWSRAGYRGTGEIPGASQRTHLIDAGDFGVIADDGIDDSVALQAAIDSALGLTRDFDNLAVVQLPAGEIDISRQINLHVSFVIIKGAGSNPEETQSTRLIFKPDINTRYDIVTAAGDLPDFDAMSHAGYDMDWLWPGRGMFKVQTLAVQDSYTTAFASSPENRKDIVQGSVNFHWKAGLSVLQNGGLVAPAGSYIIPLDTSIPNRKIAPLEVGMPVILKAADTKNMYIEQAVETRYWRDLYMKMQMFRIVAIDKVARTVTIDKPLEFDLYANNIADGSTTIQGNIRESKLVPLTNVEGVGIEDLYLTLPLTGLPKNGGGTHLATPGEAQFDYTNLAPEYALHGIVYKWASDCWVRNIRTYMTGSHAIVTEEARNLQIEDSVFEGSWNKGAGGNGYFRFSRVWDSLIQGNTLHNLRHLTLQWSASGNVVTGNVLNCDLNFHGGWERYNLVEQNLARVPREHAPNPSENWYPIWWATGPKAGKWSGSSGPRNILFNNTLSKQTLTGGAYLPYQPYTAERLPAGTVIQMGWDRETAEGSSWQHLTLGSSLLPDWSGEETTDFATGSNLGVNTLLTREGSSLFLKPYNHSYSSWASHHFGRQWTALNQAAPDADPDGDSQNNLTEYAFVGDPSAHSRNEATLSTDPDGVAIEFSKNPNASDLAWQLMTSPDLRAWQPLDSAEETLVDGTLPNRVRWNASREGLAAKQFFQVQAALQP